MGAQAAFVQHYLDLCRQSLQPVPTFEDTDPFFPIEPQQIKPDGVIWGAHTPSKIKRKKEVRLQKPANLNVQHNPPNPPLGVVLPCPQVRRR